jgi:hypothetical protein
MATFQVLTVESMKMAVFWDVGPRGLVEVYRRFGGACCLYHRPDDGCNMWHKIYIGICMSVSDSVLKSVFSVIIISDISVKALEIV